MGRWQAGKVGNFPRTKWEVFHGTKIHLFESEVKYVNAIAGLPVWRHKKNRCANKQAKTLKQTNEAELSTQKEMPTQEEMLPHKEMRKIKWRLNSERKHPKTLPLAPRSLRCFPNPLLILNLSTPALSRSLWKARPISAFLTLSEKLGVWPKTGRRVCVCFEQPIAPSTWHCMVWLWDGNLCSANTLHTDEPYLVRGVGGEQCVWVGVLKEGTNPRPSDWFHLKHENSKS